MGIIQNQSSKSTLYIYLGVAIGFANTILFPRYLGSEIKGLLDAFTSAALLLAAIFSLGVPLATLRLFPNFRNEEKKHHGYFGFLLLVSFVGFLLGLTALYFVFKEKAPENVHNWFYFLLVAVAFLFRLLFNNLDVYNRMLYNSTLGVLSSNFLLKTISLTSILLFALNFIDFQGVLLMHVFALSFPGILSLIYILFFSDKSFEFSQFKEKFQEAGIKKEFFYTSVYGFMGSVGGVVMLEIDRLMLWDFMSLNEVGIYATAAFFGIMVNIPSRALKGIASVIIADSWKKNDVGNIKMVYQKSTLNLQVISSYLFIGITICAPYVYSFMKPEYAQGISIIIYIAIAQFIDAITSVNTDILSTSKYYKYQTLFMFLMIVLVVWLNYWLIPIYGMKGAAISTMISLSVINIVRTLFIQVKLKLQPFTLKNIFLFVIAIAVYFISFYLDKWLVGSDIWHLIITVFFISIVYWTLIFSFKISPDITSAIKQIKNKFIR